jgi:hypothetical protein
MIEELLCVLGIYSIRRCGKYSSLRLYNYVDLFHDSFTFFLEQKKEGIPSSSFWNSKLLVAIGR